jgi:hypothetical protein
MGQVMRGSHRRAAPGDRPGGPVRAVAISESAATPLAKAMSYLRHLRHLRPHAGASPAIDVVWVPQRTALGREPRIICRCNGLQVVESFS